MCHYEKDAEAFHLVSAAATFRLRLGDPDGFGLDTEGTVVRGTY